MPSKKEIAREFLRLAAAGDSRKAFAQYVSPSLKHHNAYFKGDPEILMAAMEDSAREFPNKTFTMLRTLEDGDLVAVHSHIRMTPDHKGYAVMHIFRFEGDKIVEMWDFGQEVPEEEINDNGMF